MLTFKRTQQQIILYACRKKILTSPRILCKPLLIQLNNWLMARPRRRRSSTQIFRYKYKPRIVEQELFSRQIFQLFLKFCSSLSVTCRRNWPCPPSSSSAAIMTWLSSLVDHLIILHVLQKSQTKFYEWPKHRGTILSQFKTQSSWRMPRILQSKNISNRCPRRELFFY